MRERPKRIDLIIEQILLDLTLNLTEFQHLNGDSFLCEFIDSLEYLRTEATADHLQRIIDIILDLLHHFRLLLSHYPLCDHLQ